MVEPTAYSTAEFASKSLNGLGEVDTRGSLLNREGLDGERLQRVAFQRVALLQALWGCVWGSRDGVSRGCGDTGVR